METCSLPSEQLVAYVDEGLTAEQRRNVQSHIEGCERCQRKLVEFSEVDMLLCDNARFLDDAADRASILSHVKQLHTTDPRSSFLASLRAWLPRRLS